MATYKCLEASAILIPLLLWLEEDAELFDHDDCLNPYVSNSDAMPTLIFLLFDHSSKHVLLVDMEDPNEPRKIEAKLINASFSFLFLSNLEENSMPAIVAASSSVVGRKRTPSPSFFFRHPPLQQLFYG